MNVKLFRPVSMFVTLALLFAAVPTPQPSALENARAIDLGAADVPSSSAVAPLDLPQLASAATMPAQANIEPAFGKLPLYFVENQGQLDERVVYTIQGSDKTLYFTPDGVTFALTERPLRATNDERRRDVGLPNLPPGRDDGRYPQQTEDSGTLQRWAVKLDFVGANPNARPIGQDKTEAVISYFKGQPDQWHTGLPTYASIIYPDLWPGIDLVYYGTVNRLKYEFIVHPGADPNQIRMAYRGATDVTLNAAGQMQVTTPLGGFTDDTPMAYQEMDGQRVTVPMAYQTSEVSALDAARSTLYGFAVGPYDPARPLILDPAILVYCGYIGGSGSDEGYGIAVDSAGNAYVTGGTLSTEATFPIVGGPDLTFNGGNDDAFVAKVRADGAGLVYAGYIGGSNSDYGGGIAVDSDGNAYVMGETSSTQATFPVVGGPDLTYNGGPYDAFVAKVRVDGAGLVYAGYIGGSDLDGGRGIAVDGAGNAYVTGYTGSTQATFPVVGGPDLTFNGVGSDAFVAKVRVDGAGLVYCGYIGGSGNDYGMGIAVDGAGNAYVTGGTNSTEATFPIMGGPDLTYNGGTLISGDAFVAKVRADGAGLVYAGYIGGSGDDVGYGIAVDGAGNAYVTGWTESTQATFPIVGGPDLTYNGGDWDAFVAKVRADGTGLVYAGYIGGSGVECSFGCSIAVDGAGNAYVAGQTNSTEVTFPVVGGPDLTYNGGPYDAFVAKVRADGAGLVYAGYIGGNDYDSGRGIAVDSAGNAYVTGWTDSTKATFPVVGGPDLTYNGGYDAFVVKVAVAFSISGRVTDSSGNPISGVVVSAGSSGSATTNASGYYTITGLISNTYTLTPTKSGYTFSPASRTVSVPPSRTGQDFVRVPTGPMPIIMVHGFGGLGLGLFSGIGCIESDKTRQTSPADADRYFGPLDQLLAQTRPVYFARLVSNRCYTPPLIDNVPYLMEAIDEAKRATGHSKVILVAHSMGGLVSRAYIESDQYENRNDVEALFTLGSPHHGVPHDVLTFTANDFTALGDLVFDWGTFCENRQPGMCDFSVIGMDIFNHDHELNPDVKYYFLTGDTPTLSRNPLGLATDVLFLFQPNDGIVGLNSGIGNSLIVNPRVWLNRYTNDENHNIFGTGALYDWPYFGPRWNLLTSTDSKTYSECLKQVLVDGTQTTCVSTVSAASAADASPAFSRTPLEGGLLLPDETVTRTVTVDGGLALFTTRWETGTLTMTLVAPDNQVIGPAYAASNPAVVSYTTSTNGSAYYLPNALGGTWQMVVQAGVVPLTGTAYGTLVGFATNLTLVGGTDHLWYSPGTTATLTATLGSLPISAWVTATVFAGGITTTLPLSPVGGGQYQGVYAVPPAPGYVAVQLRATGVNTASLPFERELGFAFQISPNTFTLNNSYSDTPYPYQSFALYQSLTVTVGINAAVSGTVGLSANLVDAGGNPVAHSLTIQNVITGTSTLALRFEGDDIYTSGRNGPYTLTNLLLTDQRGAALVVAEAQNVYVIAAYDYHSFAVPSMIYLPLVLSQLVTA